MRASCGAPSSGSVKLSERASSFNGADTSSALQGKAFSAASIADAVRHSGAGAKPLPMTSYKLTLLGGLVQDLLEQCTA